MKSIKFVLLRILVSIFAFLLPIFCLGVTILPKQNSGIEAVGHLGNPSIEDEEFILELINEQRATRSLPDLYWNSDLANLARSYSKKMARERFFSHTDSNGKSVSDRATAMRIRKWRLIGENLFMCEGIDDFAELAVRGWMRSSGHRQNILDDRFSETGIGIAKARDGTIYVTQVFIAK